MLINKLLINGSFGNRIKESFIKNNFIEEWENIIRFSEKYKFEEFDWKRKVYHYLYNITEVPKCICGNELNFRGRPDKIYAKYCSNKCSSNNNIEDRINSLKKNNIKKYGVENVFQLESVKEKIEKTNIKKYGYSNPNKNKKVRDKIDKTNIEKYNSKTVLNIPEYREEFKKIFINKYGVDHPMKSDQIVNKLKETFSKKYGIHNPNKNEEYRVKNFDLCKNQNYIKYLDNKKSLFKCDCGQDHNFEIHKDLYHTRLKNDNPLCTICYPINDNTSIKEKEIYKYIISIYSEEVIPNYRDGLEIDIYLPILKIGFEFNGLYWHSELYKNKNYHLDKKDYFKEKGIRVIHIWEDDWTFKKEIVKSQISNWLGLSKKIYARKCTIKEVDNKISSDFLNDNHIQGVDNSNIKIGLYHKDELVSLITFNKFEGRKKLIDNEWNLSRFCNIKNVSVIGGASKLLKYFITQYEVKRIITYADKDWSNGNLYEALNFKKVHETNPDYKYIIENKRVHKSRFRNSKLDGYTEKEYIKKNDILKVWDCGKIKYEFNIYSL